MAIHDILLGPILGYEWDRATSQSYYTVIIRAKQGTKPTWEVDGKSIPMKEITVAMHDKSRVWRGEIPLKPFQETQGRNISYSIKRGATALKNVCGKSRWQFHLPASTTAKRQPKIAFCSCNGFSDPNVMRNINPLERWEKMKSLHEAEPISLLLMGGDQLYCDDIARKEGSIARLYAWLKPGEKPKEAPSPADFIQAYFDHYLLGWSRVVHEGKEYPHTAMVEMMASVPSVMMWDDHDIFDGWGSYQAGNNTLPYYKEAFDAAKQAFEVYQVRGKTSNRSLLDHAVNQPRHYSQGLQFGPYHILIMDNRSHRTPTRVMDETQWSQIQAWLKKETPSLPGERRTLLVVSPVPVVYRRFYDWVSGLPGEHGGEDDLRDHWAHKSHEGERNRLVAHLFESLKYGEKKSGYDRVTLLSGDVHVGALGFLERTDTPAEIAQIISSAIMHPAPGAVAWAGLQAISHDDEHSIKGQSVVAKMTTPIGTADRYLRCRNFVWMKEGDDQKLWVNWECEDREGSPPQKIEFGLR